MATRRSVPCCTRLRLFAWLFTPKENSPALPLQLRVLPPSWPLCRLSISWRMPSRYFVHNSSVSFIVLFGTLRRRSNHFLVKKTSMAFVKFNHLVCKTIVQSSVGRSCFPIEDHHLISENLSAPGSRFTSETVENFKSSDHFGFAI